MKKISIVTGGASGLGKELVKGLLEKGMEVCVISRNESKILKMIKEIHHEIIYYTGNIADENFVKHVFEDLTNKKYYVHYLFNCAGVAIFGEPKDMNLEKIQQSFQSNTVGLMLMTYEACKIMNYGGTIINIMSTAALKGNANESVYCASKWAARGFTEALQEYYKKSNIHIIGVYPGGMNTPFWTSDCGLNPNVEKFMKPEEVSKVILDTVMERDTSYTSSITINRIE